MESKPKVADTRDPPAEAAKQSQTPAESAEKAAESQKESELSVFYTRVETEELEKQPRVLTTPQGFPQLPSRLPPGTRVLHNQPLGNFTGNNGADPTKTLMDAVSVVGDTDDGYVRLGGRVFEKVEGARAGVL